MTALHWEACACFAAVALGYWAGGPRWALAGLAGAILAGVAREAWRS